MMHIDPGSARKSGQLTEYGRYADMHMCVFHRFSTALSRYLHTLGRAVRLYTVSRYLGSIRIRGTVSLSCSRIRFQNQYGRIAPRIKLGRSDNASSYCTVHIYSVRTYLSDYLIVSWIISSTTHPNGSPLISITDIGGLVNLSTRTLVGCPRVRVRVRFIIPMFQEISK